MGSPPAPYGSFFGVEGPWVFSARLTGRLAARERLGVPCARLTESFRLWLGNRKREARRDLRRRTARRVPGAPTIKPLPAQKPIGATRGHITERKAPDVPALGYWRQSAVYGGLWRCRRILQGERARGFRAGARLPRRGLWRSLGRDGNRGVRCRRAWRCGLLWCRYSATCKASGSLVPGWCLRGLVSPLTLLVGW